MLPFEITSVSLAGLVWISSWPWLCAILVTSSASEPCRSITLPTFTRASAPVARLNLKVPSRAIPTRLLRTVARGTVTVFDVSRMPVSLLWIRGAAAACPTVANDSASTRPPVSLSAIDPRSYSLAARADKASNAPGRRD